MKRWYCFDCGHYDDTAGYEVAYGWDDAYGARQRTEERTDLCVVCGSYDIEQVYVCELCRKEHALPGSRFCFQHMPPEEDQELIHELAKDTNPDEERENCLRKAV